jgi:GNAT superfamily N-acetyltransferase
LSASHSKPVTAAAASSQSPSGATKPFALRALKLEEAAEADTLFRQAFGTFLRLPNPLAFRPGASIFAQRLAMYPDGVFAVEEGGRLVGAAVANRWGKIGVVGPIVVAPSHWQHGVGRLLIDRIMARLIDWRCDRMRLATFPQSPGHIRLYQRYGFWPGSLSASMAQPSGALASGNGLRSRTELLSRLSAADALRHLNSCVALAGRAESGLDLTSECVLMGGGETGDVVLLMIGNEVEAFAVCAAGEGSEGGSDHCMVKLAIAGARGVPAAGLSDLLAAVSAYAADRGLSRVSATVSTGDLKTYQEMLALGFVATTHQIVMDCPPRMAAPPDREIHVLQDLR